MSYRDIFNEYLRAVGGQLRKNKPMYQVIAVPLICSALPIAYPYKVTNNAHSALITFH
jgi:hypothetical protein